MNFKKQLEKFIPGGAHTYSRGIDQFPNNSPQILSRGKGCYVYKNKKKFLDFGMGLRSVGIGYAENAIDQKVIQAIKNGNNLTLPTFLELKAAKTIVNHFENIDMVKFARHGSTAVTSAIKIARSYNGKNYILRCADHPFFSLDDWFIGSTKMARGVPDYIKKFTINFKYSDVEHLKTIINKNKDISCLIMEASTIKCPIEECCGEYPCEKSFKKNYIKDIQNICRENKIIFILDEMITGFRWDLKGAQKLYQVTPDISTFGKAIANGYSLSFVGGKRKYMEIGSISKKNKERSFILSTTHGSEAVGLSAMLSTLNFYKKYDVVEKNKIFGNELKKLFNKISNENDLIDKISMKGLPCSPYISFPMKGNKQNMLLKTFFMQEMLNKDILIPWISICYHHGNKELDMVANALVDVFKNIKKNKNLKKKVGSHILKSVFRKYN
jgi:glutamate-1-semialdehyde 2,1-aminomutase